MKNFITALFLIIAFCANSFADESSDVQKYTNHIGNEIIKIASNKKSSVEQKRQELITFIEGIVDTDWVAKFVLARNYRTASNEQRERFRKLYKEFMINTYAPKFRGYSGEKFEVISVKKQDGYYLVKCIFYPKEPPAVNLGFRIRNKPNNSNFVVLDIVAEGVSLIETQRSDFGASISANGLDKFLDDLEVRVKNLKLESSKEIDHKKKMATK